MNAKDEIIKKLRNRRNEDHTRIKVEQQDQGDRRNIEIKHFSEVKSLLEEISLEVGKKPIFRVSVKVDIKSAIITQDLGGPTRVGRGSNRTWLARAYHEWKYLYDFEKKCLSCRHKYQSSVLDVSISALKRIYYSFANTPEPQISLKYFKCPSNLVEDFANRINELDLLERNR